MDVLDTYSVLNVEIAPATDALSASSGDVKLFAGEKIPSSHSVDLNVRSHAVLCDGFRILAQHLLLAEADFLCGVPLTARSKKRTNYRVGYHPRQIRTKLGRIHVRIPQLRYLDLRPSMSKRFRRLEGLAFEALTNILEFGPAPQFIEPLIKTLWTVHLPDVFFRKLSGELINLFGEWRWRSLFAASAGNPPSTYAPAAALYPASTPTPGTSSSVEIATARLSPPGVNPMPQGYSVY